VSSAAPSPPRILLVRPDHLGDVLLTLPAATILRDALPGAHITYLVSENVAAVTRRCPAVDETLTAPFPPLPAWPHPTGWTDSVERAAPALRGRFDLAILTRPDDPVSGALVTAAGVPVRLGYAEPCTRPFLTVALPMPDRRHVVTAASDLALAAVRHFEGVVRSDSGGPPYVVPSAEDEDEATSALGPPRECGGPGPIVLHPGSGWPIKNWPPRRWGQLAAAVSESYGVTPLVTGGPGERALVDGIVEASGRRAIGLAGRLSLGGLAALFARARLVVATDSGPLHLAALLGTPVVGLYGPADPLEFGPWCDERRRRIVRTELACSPCRILDVPPCGAVAEPRCIVEIGVEAVVEVVADLLGASI
jgi:ADP-heptose:LPS heptosyltransferase